jgi:hypothetical protein
MSWRSIDSDFVLLFSSQRMSIAVNMLMCEAVSLLSDAALIRNFLSRSGTVIFAIF